MKRMLVLTSLLLLAALQLTGCSTMKFKDTWKRPGYTGKVHKVYLVGVTRNDKFRRLFEDEFARLLKARGVTGIPSYKDLVISGNIDREALRARLRAQGTDAVLVTRIAGREQKTASYSGAEAGFTTPGPLNVYYDEYYNSSVTIVATGPAVESQFQIISLSTTLFETESAESVWSALIETTAGDNNREQRLKEFAEQVVLKMQEDRLF